MGFSPPPRSQLTFTTPLSVRVAVTAWGGSGGSLSICTDAEALINWDTVDWMRPYGGIRIEDDVLVTADGCEVLTAGVPKQPDDIEAIMAA